ncbi:hypothetical protein BDF14DRAFT_196162 [Spinellus fusiger]|nr:hypothetical protein BDF14DRAFT_196162 [Spinellus fusiger]
MTSHTFCRGKEKEKEKSTVQCSGHTILKKYFDMAVYTPGSLATLLSTHHDAKLEDLFQKSAGPSQIVKVPTPFIRAPTTTTKVEKKVLSKKKQDKQLALKAVEAANKARALTALAPLQHKRKADSSLQSPTKKKEKKAPETEEEKKIKEQRTLFVGNVPVQCIEKVIEIGIRG